MKHSIVGSSPAACATPTQEESHPHTLEIIIHPTGRPGAFAVTLGSQILVKSSRQPRSDAARALHDLGFTDGTLLVSRRAASEAVSMQGPLGSWRKLSVREGRNGPEFVAYRPFPCTRVEQRKAKTGICPKGPGTKINASSPPPGAAEAGPAASTCIGDAPSIAPNEPREEKPRSSLNRYR
jgi:hypothetical protein